MPKLKSATPEYRNLFEKSFNKIVFDLMKEKLFVSLGLELTSINIQFMDNSNFPLKDFTFGFYNPIDNTISVNIEDPFFLNTDSDKDLYSKITFIFFHEAYHRMLLHTDRAGVKDKDIWNIACDYEVHNMLHLYSELCLAQQLEVSKYFDFIKDMMEKWNNKNFEPNRERGEIKGLYSSKMLDKVAEEIYALIMNSKKTSTKSMSLSMSQMRGEGQNQDQGKDGNNQSNKGEKQPGNGNGSGNDDGGMQVEVTETEYTLPDGTKHKTVSIKWPEAAKKPMTPEEAKEQKNAGELRRQLMENNLTKECEKCKGNISSDSQKFIKKLFKIKIDWEKILKASLQTILTKSDSFTWARPRTSMFAMDVYLPDIDTCAEKYGTLIVARDESGSMSDDDVAKCAQIIMDAKEHYKKIIVLKHDTEIVSNEEFEELNDEVIKGICMRAASGGTSHKPVFEFIKEYAKSHPYEEDVISCVILMSDCCSDIQQYQDLVPSKTPMIYLVPAADIETGYTEGIKGKIIPIE